MALTTACRRQAAAADKLPINLHADEFNELMGDEFIPLINKGGGAGIQVTAYTQTLSDIEARIGNRAKAGQVIGNFNTLQMLRVRETATAELLTQQLPKINVLTKTLVSGATDTSDPEANTDFTSSSQDRVSSTSVPLIEPAHIVSLPKGQMSLLPGGRAALESSHATAQAFARRCHAQGFAGTDSADARQLQRAGGALVECERWRTDARLRSGSSHTTPHLRSGWTPCAHSSRPYDYVGSSTPRGVKEDDFSSAPSTATHPAPRANRLGD